MLNKNLFSIYSIQLLFFSEIKLFFKKKMKRKDKKVVEGKKVLEEGKKYFTLIGKYYNEEIKDNIYKSEVDFNFLNNLIKENEIKYLCIQDYYFYGDGKVMERKEKTIITEEDRLINEEEMKILFENLQNKTNYFKSLGFNRLIILKIFRCLF
jgi:hypothetical protein